MLLLIDNYDSFTYNLVHFLGELGAEIVVKRNDALTVGQALDLRPEASCCRPARAIPTGPASASTLIAPRPGRIPLLGVCLGHQAIGQAFGGRVIRAPVPMHGKISMMSHSGKGVFGGPAHPVPGHPLPFADRRAGKPARRAEGHGGKRGRSDHGAGAPALPIHGVQFHPESIASEHGHELLRIPRPYRRSGSRPDDRHPIERAHQADMSI